MTCSLLVGTLGASGTKQADLRETTCGLLAGMTGTKSFRQGFEHPGAAGGGEVKTCRGGDVVKAGAEVTLNELGPK